MPFYESFGEFAQRMDCEHVSRGQRVVFENGGQSDGHLSHMDPPEDRPSRLKVKREFVAIKLATLERSFNNLKQAILDQANFHSKGAGPLPDQEDIDELKRLPKVIEKLRNRLAKIEAQIGDLPERQDLRQEWRDSQRQAAANVISEVAGINIDD